MAPLRSILVLLLAISSSSRKVEPKAKETKSLSSPQPNRLTSSTRIDPSRVVQLSWHPRAFLYKGFLSDEECDHLISLAHDKLKKFPVIDDNSGNSNINTGQMMSLARGQDDVISKIEERISAWTFLPRENGEAMLVMHYGTNESYKPHYDYIQDKSKSELGGDRIATVLVYLSNVTRGGETVFPQTELKGAQSKDDTWSACASTGYAVKPVKGNALLFFSLFPDAKPDDSSLHGGCTVLEGEKWTATKYIHVKSIHLNEPSLASDGDCTDEDDNCPNWAAMGECQRNPIYMLGTPDYYGTCRKSCSAC